MKGSRFAHLVWVIAVIVAAVCLLACAYEFYTVWSAVFREAGDLVPAWALLGAGVLMLIVSAFMRVLEGIAGSLEELASAKSGEGRS